MSRRKYNGWSLKVYDWEAQIYPEFRKAIKTREEAESLLKKFARYFKTTCPRLTSKLKRGDAGYYMPSPLYPSITLGKEPSLAVICHEFAHHLETVKWNTKQWHGKKFKRELKRVYTFAKRYLPQSLQVAYEAPNTQSVS